MQGQRGAAPSFVPFSRDNREPVSMTSHLAQLEQIGKLRSKEIKPGTELRITVAQEDDLYLRAHSRIPDTFATAEIFGMELVMGHEYKIQRGTSIAIFSWHGCTIEMRGPTAVEYDASNHVMGEYVNLAAFVEQKRQRAEEQSLTAPRVLVTGSNQSGKSTLCLFLSNYALRKHRRPIYVELDPASLSSHRQLPAVPGIVSALHTDHSAYELNQEPVHPNRLNLHKGIDQGVAAQHLNPNYPIGKSISFWLGSEDWRADPVVYWKCIAQLACMVSAKEEVIAANTDPVIQADGVKLENPLKGGLIVNAPRDPSADLLEEIIKLYSINVVAVVDDEERFASLTAKFASEQDGETGDELLRSGSSKNALVYLDAIESETEDVSVDIVHVSKAGAVIPVASHEDRNRFTHMKYADYFHGPERDLVCHNFIVPLRELFISRIVTNTDGAGHWRQQFALKPFEDAPGRLRHSVLAVVLAPTHEEVTVSSVAGLVWVRDVTDPEDPVNAQLHIMCPSSGHLASPYLLHGDLDNLKYFE